MNNKKKLLGALAVAGIVAASGSAFTATGLASNAGPTQFVGGTVSQSVSGATLSDVTYGFTDATKTAVSSIDLTIAGADGKTVDVTASGNALMGTFDCADVANGHSLCSYVAADVETGYTGLTGISVTVNS